MKNPFLRKIVGFILILMLVAGSYPVNGLTAPPAESAIVTSGNNGGADVSPDVSASYKNDSFEFERQNSAENLMADFAVTALDDDSDFSYLILDNDYCTITGYIGSDTDISIPQTIDGYTVQSISSGAFQNKTTLRGATLPNTVIAIGDNAFRGCTGLTAVSLPTVTLTSIGSYAFYGCTSLEALVLPDSVATLGSNVFRNCTNLAAVNYPRSLSTVSATVWSDLRSYLFAGTSIKSIVVPEGVTVIPAYTFSGSDSLESVVLPGTLTGIGDNAFMSCTGLGSIDLSGTALAAIGASAFNGCTGLASVNLPSGTLATIGNSAFYGCTSLTSLALPDSLTGIGNEAFRNCTKLSSINYPVGLATSGTNVYAGCSALEAITVPEGITIIPANTYYGAAGIVSVTLPGTLTEIGDYAFRDCTGLSSINLEDTALTTIRSYAFYGCTAIGALVLPDSVATLGSNVFRNCANLAAINYPRSLSTVSATVWSDLRSYLFAGTSIKSIVVPEGVTVIPAYTFGGSDSLESVYLPISVASIGLNAFLGLPEAFTIYAYLGSYAYQYAVDNGIRVSSLGELRAVSILVEDEDNNPVSSGYAIYWYIKGENNPIASGATAYINVSDGIEYEFSVVLGDSLGTVYKEPARQALSLVGDQAAVTLALVKIPQLSVSGMVTDSSGNPLKDATILFTQRTNGRFVVEQTTQTGEDGSFATVLLKAETDVTASKDGYINAMLRNALTEDSPPNVTLNTIVLRALDNRLITLSVTSRKASDGDGDGPGAKYMINSFSNLGFTANNITQGKQLIAPTAQYPYLILEDDDLNPGDLIEITVNDNFRRMVALPVRVSLDAKLSGTASVEFTDYGYFTASVSVSGSGGGGGSGSGSGIGGASGSGGASGLVMIFDSAGNFIDSRSFVGGLNGPPLPAGDYAAVFMENNGLIAKVLTIGKFAELGLRDGADYILKQAHIENGRITDLGAVGIPQLDLGKLSYLAESSFISNKDTMVLGAGFATLRLEFSLKNGQAYSEETLQIELQPGLELLNGGVTLDNKSIPYTYSNSNSNTNSNGLITVIVNKPSGLLRLCVAPSEAGSLFASAFLSFKLDGAAVLQPIGQVTLTATPMQINVPQKVGRGYFFATGYTQAYSMITLYAGATAVGDAMAVQANSGLSVAGHATANANGQWKARVELNNPEDLSIVEVYAIAQSDQGVSVKSDNALLFYDENFCVVSQVTMINVAHPGGGGDREIETIIDFIDPPAAAPVYWYYPLYPKFTFVVEFTNPDMISGNVFVLVTGNNGVYTKIPTVYDSISKTWIGTVDLDSYHCPRQINVLYGDNTLVNMDGDVYLDIGDPDYDPEFNPDYYPDYDIDYDPDYDSDYDSDYYTNYSTESVPNCDIICDMSCCMSGDTDCGMDCDIGCCMSGDMDCGMDCDMGCCMSSGMDCGMDCDMGCCMSGDMCCDMCCDMNHDMGSDICCDTAPTPERFDVAAMSADFPMDDVPPWPWKQGRGWWADLTWLAKDSSGNTYIADMKSKGCMITSLANLIHMSGAAPLIDPGRLLLEALGCGQMNSAGDIVYSNMTSIVPNFHYVRWDSASGDIKQKVCKINSLIHQGYYIVVAVNGASHFVAVRNVVGNKIMIMDPGYAKTELFADYPAAKTGDVSLRLFRTDYSDYSSNSNKAPCKCGCAVPGCECGLACGCGCDINKCNCGGSGSCQAKCPCGCGKLASECGCGGSGSCQAKCPCGCGKLESECGCGGSGSCQAKCTCGCGKLVSECSCGGSGSCQAKCPCGCGKLVSECGCGGDGSCKDKCECGCGMEVCDCHGLGYCQTCECGCGIQGCACSGTHGGVGDCTFCKCGCGSLASECGCGGDGSCMECSCNCGIENCGCGGDGSCRECSCNCGIENCGCGGDGSCRECSCSSGGPCTCDGECNCPPPPPPPPPPAPTAANCSIVVLICFNSVPTSTGRVCGYVL